MVSRPELEVMILSSLQTVRGAEKRFEKRLRTLRPEKKTACQSAALALTYLDEQTMLLERLVDALGSDQLHRLSA